LQARDQQELLEKLAVIGIRRIQMDLDRLREEPEAWDELASVFAKNNVSIISGMLRCAGEDYSTLETIRATGGIVPDDTWEENLRNFRRGAEFAARLGLRLITIHAGFVPHREEAGYAKLRERLLAVDALFAAKGIALGLETGQETAEELAELLRDLGSGNIGVNFDPANMILYGKGDPVAAVRTLAPWLRQLHLKDARHSKVPGTWGEEVPVGRGDVDWARFFEALRELGFAGDMAIEREAGDRRVADICAGRDFLGEFAIRAE
jgi:sugar phosphate isomerase/epimerase